MAKMAPECAIEFIKPARGIAIFERGNLLEQIGMAADRALAELNEAAGDDVGALNRDPDRNSAIKAAEIIKRAFLHRLAAMDVHRVIGDNAQALGRLLFHDGGDHRGGVTVIDRRTSEPPSGIEQIGGGRNAPEQFLDRLEAADGNVKLFANARIGSAYVRSKRTAGGGQRRQ